MRLSLLALVLATAAAACGGSQKKADPVPLPEPKVEEAKTAESEAKPAEEKPAAPQPIDVTLPAPTVTVKLVSAGKGKKEVMKIAPAAGSKQAVEFAIDFVGKSTGGKEGPAEDIMPTVVLTGDAEIKNVDQDGTSEYVLTVTGTDARDVPNAKAPADQVKAVLAALQGMQIGGTVKANGTASETKWHIEEPSQQALGALQLVMLAFPSHPVLPTEPVGVGAKWKVVATSKFADQLDVTATTDYQVVSHKDKTWKIKGTTKVSGADQPVGPAKATKIGGNGTIEATIVDGAFYPTMTSGSQTGFTIEGTDPQNQQPINGSLEIKQKATITPKT